MMVQKLRLSTLLLLGCSRDPSSLARPRLSAETNHLLSRGYTGAYLGLYASSNGRQSSDHADFDWVRYQAFERK